MQDFQGRHAVVTGGTGALGTAVVGRLLAGGATCHVTFLIDRELETFPYRDKVRLTRVDCTSGRAVTDFYQSLGRLDASIHLVGGFASTEVAETSVDEFRRLFEINAVSCFLCCREAVRRLRALRQSGRLVNVAARPALQPAGGMLAYTTAKAAVASMTQCLAEELKDAGILVNAVVPSIIDTPANRRAMPGADADQWPKPDQVAEAIAFLAGPGNALTSGSLVPVYGRA